MGQNNDKEKKDNEEKKDIERYRYFEDSTKEKTKNNSK